jgi:hypothetical protein
MKGMKTLLATLSFTVAVIRAGLCNMIDLAAYSDLVVDNLINATKSNSPGSPDDMFEVVLQLGRLVELSQQMRARIAAIDGESLTIRARFMRIDALSIHP